MAYKRSVMCRYCYTSGHTRRTCPEIKRRAASGDKNCQNMIENYKSAAASRKCSYCSTIGHTLRNCMDRTNDGAVFESLNLEFRDETKKLLDQKKFAVGNLFYSSKARYGETPTQVLCYVEKIQLDGQNATGNWLNTRLENAERFHGSNTAGHTRAISEHNQYRRYFKSVKPKGRRSRRQSDDKLGCYISFRSMSGTGLGYWGEDEFVCDAADDFLYSYSYSSNAYKAVA